MSDYRSGRNSFDPSCDPSVPITQHVRALPRNLPIESDGLVGLGELGDDAAAGAENALHEYVKVFLKYRTIIAACAGVSVLLALLYAFTATPLYSASSKLRIGTYEPVLAATKIEDMLHEKSRESNYLETQIQELKSYSLADKVLQDSEVRAAFQNSAASPGFFARLLFGEDGAQGNKRSEPSAAYQATLPEMDKYLRAISIQPVRRTSLVSIEVTHVDPRVAAMVANKHAAAYIDWVRESRIEQQTRGLAFLRAQSEELREKVADLERELADYAEANSIVALNKDENIVAQKMSQVNKLLTDATAKRIEIENLYKEAEASLKDPSAGFDDSSTQVMRSELAKLEAEYQQLSTKFTEQYPRVQQLKSQISGLRGSIEGQRRQIVLGIKAKMLAAREEEKKLIEELEQQKSQAFELSKRQVQYNILNRELTTSRDLLHNVLSQIKETSLTVESNASNVSIVDYAIAPVSPSAPRKGLILVLGLCFGIGLGVGSAFLLHSLDNSVRTPEDLADVLRLPNLGVVPTFDEKLLESGTVRLPKASLPDAGASDVEDHAQAGGDGSVIAASDAVFSDAVPVESAHSEVPFVEFLANPKSLVSEAYRTIRTGLLLSQAGEPPRTILLTSSQSSEGKTTSSINLAASLAGSGGKVVLVDADLRRPSVHKRLNLISNEPGLSEVLTGQLSIQQVIRSEVLPRISVVSSGSIPPNPAELLGSSEMANFLDELARNFDYVLIDSPPILPITDAVILSRLVDGVVLIVRGGSTPRRVVAAAKARLQSVGARVLGAVLNDVDISRGEYYYYNRYYYSYYNEPERSERGRAKRAAQSS